MPDAEKPRLPLAEIAVTLAGIALIGVVILAVPALRESFQAALRGDSDAVRAEVDSLGIGGPLLISAG